MSAINWQKRNYYKGVRNIQFTVREFVMCHDKTKKVGRNPGLRHNWRGPFVIMNKHNPANVAIQRSAGKKEITVYMDRLKHCFSARKRGFKWAKSG